MAEPTGGQKTLGVVTQVEKIVSLVVGNTRCFALPDEVKGKPEVGSVVTIGRLKDDGSGQVFGVKVVGHIGEVVKPVIEVYRTLTPYAFGSGLRGRPDLCRDAPTPGLAVEALLRLLEASGLPHCLSAYRVVWRD